MNNVPKKGLDPLVECSEGVELTEAQADPKCSYSVFDETLTVEPELTSLCPSTSKSTEAVATRNKNEGKRKKNGSRLSLASLFSFGSQNRERSRSRWSCEDQVATGEVMSSLSVTDLRSTATNTSNTSASVSKRNRCSDGGSCQDAADDCSEKLLPELELSETEEEETNSSGKKKAKKMLDCPLCCMRQPVSHFPKLLGCSHRSCRLCLMQYVELEIMENRVEVSCPECSNTLHPEDIKKLTGNRRHLIDKYEEFSVRRCLLTEPDARWCPAPDCGFAVIASSCAACPQLRCGRPSCGALFCYHCKGSWHPSQTCDEARRIRIMQDRQIQARHSALRRITSASIELKPGDIKACPRCRTLIVKMDDGSCNHMVCAMCSAEFCWLCLKEISDLHYLSPTGCTFWGKKPWTKKKKLLWQIGTLIGAPVGIALIAGLSIPGIIFGVPIVVGKKVHQRFLKHKKAQRRAITIACVVGSLVFSPVLAVMAVGVGVPIMLAYVYGVVPLSLCRNGGCGLSDGTPPTETEIQDEEEIWREATGVDTQLLADLERDTTSIAPGVSLRSGSISTNHVRLAVHNYPKRARSPSMSSGSGRMSPDAPVNYEEASTKAMAGSHYHFYCDDKSVHTMCSTQEATSYTDEVASTKALAGSVHDSKSLCERPKREEQGTHEELHGSCSNPPSSVEHVRHSDHVEHRKTVRTSIDKPGHSHSQGTHDTDSVDVEAQLPSNSKGHGYPVHQTSLDGKESRDDPFKIRGFLDNMKQMVAIDLPLDKPYEPAPSARISATRVRRSGSGKSLITVATQVSSNGETHLVRSDPSASVSSSIPAPTSGKRGFFRSLFSRKK